MPQIDTVRRDWRRIALPASIVLNIFLIAIVAGHALTGLRGAAILNDPVARVLANATAVLPPKDAELFNKSILDAAPRYADGAKGLIKARQRLIARIATEPFDPDAVQQELKNWRAATDSFFEAFDGPLTDALAKLSPESRRRGLAAEQGRAAP
ncbi:MULTISPECIES: periplasmic heavy metal sensor [unclassified Bradyrhizobium]|uniref:periplasmic heavy metal sensor n=1 Tax=unclassified Bradyrhizobium TaxID=2631580 RepID=UPI0028EEB990|nr:MULTISPECIES: periplasmic heavy metal sensor [unclassified Bradyrhizobium]